MNIIKPNKLKSGNTIAIVAPAGNIDYEKISKAKNYFINKGFNVRIAQHINCQDRYFSASDNKRIEDIHNAFEDNEIDAIICARGGYGSIRLINKINYEIIKNNPKIFCGYSDITALSTMILKNSGLITFSAPMAQSDFAKDKIDKITESEFWETLTNDKITIKPNNNFKIFKKGEASGISFGGNLATLASLCGQDFIPDENFIFFAEDINEDTYKIDKYFRQLLNIPKFKKNVSGIVLGEFINTDDENLLNKLFEEIAEELNIPTFSGYYISHGQTKCTIPIGASTTLNSDGNIEFIY